MRLETCRLCILIVLVGVVLEGVKSDDRGEEGSLSESTALWSYGERRRVSGGPMGRRRRRFYGRPRTRVGSSRKIVHRTSSVSTTNDIVGFKSIQGGREHFKSHNQMDQQYTGDLKRDINAVEEERRVTKEDNLNKKEEIRAKEKVIEEEKLEAHRKRLRALLSPESRRIPRPVPVTTTEQPQKQESVQPGGFQCPNQTEAEVVWRAFPSPSSCRLYYICVDGQEPQEHGCSIGRVFNKNTQVCDEAHRVPGCEDFYEEDTREDKGIGDGLDPDEEKQYFGEFVEMLRDSGLFKRALIDLLSKMKAT